MTIRNECCNEIRPETTQGRGQGDQKTPMNNCEPVIAKARQIRINPLNYGYLVEVGCQSFAIEDIDKLTKYLTLYLKSPNSIENSWLDGKLKLE